MTTHKTDALDTELDPFVKSFAMELMSATRPERVIDHYNKQFKTHYLSREAVREAIKGQEVDVGATRERMEELGASETEILNMEIGADDTKATLDGVRKALGLEGADSE